MYRNVRLSGSMKAGESIVVGCWEETQKLERGAMEFGIAAPILKGGIRPTIHPLVDACDSSFEWILGTSSNPL